jgi:riboflavin synthase
MFTGLVEDVGVVAQAQRIVTRAPGAPPGGPPGMPAGVANPSAGFSMTPAPTADALSLWIVPQRIPLAELSVGESICHDGACLTVTDVGGSGPVREAFHVLAGLETLARTALGSVAVGKRVNLERALKVGDRLGGHWVTGHIDDVGELASRTDAGSNLVLVIRARPAVLRYVVEKGSIAVAGVSLTVNHVDDEKFSVALIPHTCEHTNLGDLAVGDRVNLEADILAKHVEKLVKP